MLPYLQAVGPGLRVSPRFFLECWLHVAGVPYSFGLSFRRVRAGQTARFRLWPH